MKLLQLRVKKYYSENGLSLQKKEKIMIYCGLKYVIFTPMESSKVFGRLNLTQPNPITSPMKD